MRRIQAPRARKSGPKGLPRNVYRRTQVGGHRGAASTEPFCHVKTQCGACKFVNLPYENGLKEKYESGLAVLESAGVTQSARLLPPVKSPRPFEYRSLFKLAVRPAPVVAPTEPTLVDPLKILDDEDDAPAGADVPRRFSIGLFEPGSHKVVDMDECPLHTAPLKRLLRDLRSELDRSPLTPFDETNHTGIVRYIAARSAHLTGELMVTFVVTEQAKVELKRIVANLQRRGHKINSAHMNLNTERGNAIFGQETIRLAGADGLRERLCDLDFEIAPTSFFQINPWQAINLYRRVEQIAGEVRGEPVAWDLYCGTGQISLILARQGYRVLGIEESSQSVTDAQVNARKNHLDGRATFLASRVEDAHGRLPVWAQSPTLIVVNPSRRGLAETTRQHLAMLLVSNPECRFIYVSCEVETLARDLKDLAKTGFQTRQIEAFDMFPQTDNMEWLAILTR